MSRPAVDVLLRTHRDDRARLEDILVHGYFATDLKEVWVTVERRVPTLRRQIETILRGETSGRPPSVSERRRAYQLTNLALVSNTGQECASC